MSDYPVPKYAAYAWVSGDQLWLGFSSPLNGHAHSVAFPATEKGLKLAIGTLRERENSTRLEIGFNGAPTKYQVERALADDKRYNEILRAMREAQKPKDSPELSAILAEMGI